MFYFENYGIIKYSLKVTKTVLKINTYKLLGVVIMIDLTHSMSFYEINLTRDLKISSFSVYLTKKAAEYYERELEDFEPPKTSYCIGTFTSEESMEQFCLDARLDFPLYEFKNTRAYESKNIKARYITIESQRIEYKELTHPLKVTVDKDFKPVLFHVNTPLGVLKLHLLDYIAICDILSLDPVIYSSKEGFKIREGYNKIETEEGDRTAGVPKPEGAFAVVSEVRVMGYGGGGGVSFGASYKGTFAVYEVNANLLRFEALHASKRSILKNETHLTAGEVFYVSSTCIQEMK